MNRSKRLLDLLSEYRAKGIVSNFDRNINIDYNLLASTNKDHPEFQSRVCSLLYDIYTSSREAGTASTFRAEPGTTNVVRDSRIAEELAIHKIARKTELSSRLEALQEQFKQIEITRKRLDREISELNRVLSGPLDYKNVKFWNRYLL